MAAIPPALPSTWYEVCLSRDLDDSDDAVRMAAFVSEGAAWRHLDRLDEALSNLVTATGDLTDQAIARVERLTGRRYFDLDDFEGVQLTVWRVTRVKNRGTLAMSRIEDNRYPEAPA